MEATLHRLASCRLPPLYADMIPHCPSFNESRSNLNRIYSQSMWKNLHRKVQFVSFRQVKQFAKGECQSRFPVILNVDNVVI